MFLLGNLFSTLFFFLLFNGTVIIGDLNLWESLTFHLFFFGISETLPIYSFYYVTNKYLSILNEGDRVEVVN